MPKTTRSFLFCVHAHQPVGNFGHVFAEAADRCYSPFFEVMREHPDFSFSCHISGSLLDWLELNRPELIRLMRQLAQKGQAEFLGGAYYEPIFGVIPARDLAGQIAMMRSKVRQLFGQDPKGAWLTERVWDPALIQPLADAGVQYTVLDDIHFEKARVRMPVTGYYRTRHGKFMLDLFASHKSLRYLMPFRAPEDTLRYLRSLKGAPDHSVVFADDCEKFGLWPGTHEWVYDQKWLHRFLTLIEKDDTIQPRTFSQLRAFQKPRAVIKVPQASYSEMMQWSGGRFDNFFEKYPESKYMKERMTQVSARLAVAGHADLDQRSEARQALYRAQCNCSYWHGVFGGLYLHHLRSAVYENLIQAEVCLNGHGKTSWERVDKKDRWVLRQKNIVSFFNARYGAAMEELDFLPRPANLVCTLQRRPESYHALAQPKSKTNTLDAVSSIHQMLGLKDKDISGHIFYDSLRRLCFVDHFFEGEIGPDTFHHSLYVDQGDFADGVYRTSHKAERLIFKRRGRIKAGKRSMRVQIEKTVTPDAESGVQVAYKIQNLERNAFRVVFGTEFNFSIGDAEAMKGLNVPATKQWTFEDGWRNITIDWRSDLSGRLLAVPVETVSESEGGLEKTFQQLSVLFQRELSFASKECKEFQIGLRVRGKGL